MPTSASRSAARRAANPNRKPGSGGRRAGSGRKAKTDQVGHQARGRHLRPDELPAGLKLARDGGLACHYSIDEKGDPVVDPLDDLARTNWLTAADPLGSTEWEND